MKYVFQHSSLTFLSIASGRIIIGFLFLAGITACLDWKGLWSLSLADGAQFGDGLGKLRVRLHVRAGLRRDAGDSLSDIVEERARDAYRGAEQERDLARAPPAHPRWARPRPAVLCF